MLDNKQIKFLIDKEIIHNGSIVTIDKKKNDIQVVPEYRVTDISHVNNDYIINAINIIDKMFSKDVRKCIETIDDMNVDRLLEAYMAEDEINTIDVIRKTNASETIIGKSKATINGTILKDGMKIIFHNDSNKNLCNKLFTVRGVGTSIKLIAQRGRPKKNK